MVYSEHTPVKQKQHKKHENDQWRLLHIQKNLQSETNSAEHHFNES